MSQFEIETCEALGLRACGLAHMLKLSAAQFRLAAALHLACAVTSHGSEINGSDPVASFSLQRGSVALVRNSSQELDRRTYRVSDR
jgi:hypothetical protein